MNNWTWIIIAALVGFWMQQSYKLLAEAVGWLRAIHKLLEDATGGPLPVGVVIDDYIRKHAAK